MSKRDLVVKPLIEEDLEQADSIVRVAFGTFLGLPDPTKMFDDRSMLVNRWRSNPNNVLGAYLDGHLVGSNVVSRWGTFGSFGPLSIRPDLWDKGIAKQLLEPTMDLFAKWQTTQEGLFTFAQSPKHVGIYQKFGFNARFLTAIMEKKVTKNDLSPQYKTLSESLGEVEPFLQECYELTDGIYDGLDLSSEIKAVKNLKLGDVVLAKQDSKTIGFAVCHVGAGTEAGSDLCYIKFGAASSNGAFGKLLDACEHFALRKGISKIEAGMNLERREAYETMLSHGFRSEFQGVSMQTRNGRGFNREDVFIIDDWR